MNNNNTLNLSNRTVQQLRQIDKCKVQIIHQRYVKNNEGTFDLLPIFKIEDMSKCYGKGGESRIFLTTPDGKDYLGISKCSLRDSFSYKIGREIALGRLQVNEATMRYYKPENKN